MLRSSGRKFLHTAAALAAAIVLWISPAESALSLTAMASTYPVTAGAQTIPDEIAGSTYAILVNQATGEVVASKNGEAVMFPASMTKVMTLLVAAEHVTDLTDTYTITQDILDYCAAHDCSTVGFAAGETVTVMDLLWGTILPSGADAAVALGRYVAGSDEAFVALMNQKAAELGLTTTHFTNCVGLYDNLHFSSCADIAAIMNAAAQNTLALTVLGTRTYTTVPTIYHPDGITVSNLFLSRIDPLDTGGVVFAAKTGYINQSRYCAVSYYFSASGTPYICVTGSASSSMNAVYDHQNIYNTYAR